jgi:hypothetical protein
MSNISSNDLISDVAPGDIVLAARGSGEPAPYKVVHMDYRAGEDDARPASVLVTFEGDGGETFDVEYRADARVTRSLEAKWESDQSPTQHEPN